MKKGSSGRVLGMCIAYALVHSGLATLQLKGFVRQVLGENRRNGFYRAVYNGQALLVTGLAAWWFRRQPDYTLYKVSAPWSWLFYGGQLASLGLLLTATKHIGFAAFSGLPQLKTLLTGGLPMPEPEAQGPRLDTAGEIKASGPFRVIRHPSDVAGAGLFIFFPHMTANRATLAICSLVYTLLGAWHEEYRLAKRYGDPYTRYAQKVPFMFPGLGLINSWFIRALRRK